MGGNKINWVEPYTWSGAVFCSAPYRRPRRRRHYHHFRLVATCTNFEPLITASSVGAGLKIAPDQVGGSPSARPTMVGLERAAWRATK